MFLSNEAKFRMEFLLDSSFLNEKKLKFSQNTYFLHILIFYSLQQSIALFEILDAFSQF